MSLAHVPDNGISSLAEFWYNTTYHSAVGRYHLEVLYEYSRQHFGINNSSVQTTTELDDWLTGRHTLTEVVQHQLDPAR